MEIRLMYVLVAFLRLSLCKASSSSDKISTAAALESEIRSTAEAVNSTCIFVTWSRTSRGESLARCPTRYYAVRLKQEAWKRARSWRFNASLSSATLCDLKANTQYIVRIVTETTCDVKGRPSRWLTVRTSLGRQVKDIRDNSRADSSKDDRVPGAPTVVRSRPHSDSVFISWQAPDGSPPVTGYIIGYGEGVPDVNWQYLEAHRRNATIKNLKKATQYVVSVRAFNDIDKGPVVYELVYTTDDSASPPGDWPTPTSLRTRILSPKTAWFGWTDPSLGQVQQITDNRYYNVHYQATPNGKTMSVIVKDLHVTLHDLQPGTWYEFKVRTIKDGQTSSFSDVITNQTSDASERGSSSLSSVSRSSSSLASTPAAARRVSADRRQPTVAPVTAALPPPSNDKHTAQFRDNDEEDDDEHNFGTTPITSNTNRRMAKQHDWPSQGSSRNDAPAAGLAAVNAAAAAAAAGSRADRGTASPVVSASLVNSNNNDDDDQADAKHDGKMKREHGASRRDDATSRHDDATTASGGATSRGASDESQLPTVTFNSLVQIKVSAYITWPADGFDLVRHACGGEPSAAAPVVGYRLRYQTVDNNDDVREYVTQNLSTNFVLLENLSANARYKYQVKYLLENGTSTEWSASGYLNTRY